MTIIELDTIRHITVVLDNQADQTDQELVVAAILRASKDYPWLQAEPLFLRYEVRRPGLDPAIYHDAAEITELAEERVHYAAGILNLEDVLLEQGHPLEPTINLDIEQFHVSH